MREEAVVKIIAFISIVAVYAITVLKASPSPDLVQALFTAVVGAITSIIGYNVGKKLGSLRKKK